MVISLRRRRAMEAFSEERPPLGRLGEGHLVQAHPPQLAQLEEVA